MREFMKAELVKRGFIPVRFPKWRYLGYAFKDGREIITKDALGDGRYVVHGAQDAFGKRYDECEINFALDGRVETLQELEAFLKNPNSPSLQPT